MDPRLIAQRMIHRRTDESVASTELLAILAAWGPCNNCPEDINLDGTVNVLDLIQLLLAFGTTCP